MLVSFPSVESPSQKTPSTSNAPSPSTSSKLSIHPYYTPKWLLIILFHVLGCTDKESAVVTQHSALIAKRGLSALSACSKKRIFVHTYCRKEAKRKEWTTWADVVYVRNRERKWRKTRRERNEKKEVWAGGRGKTTISRVEMEERRQEQKGNTRKEWTTCSWVSWKNYWGGQALIPQLENTHLTILAQAPIPIQWDIKQSIMSQDLIHLPHAQGVHWTIQWTVMIPQIKRWAMLSMTTITLTTSKGYCMTTIQ